MKAGLIAAAFFAAFALAQTRVDTTNWTAAQDHQNMMDQLGIKALRPGPSGNESAPNHANYDEATANPYPNLPDVLTLKSGAKVTTPAMWWNQRRPEIVEDFAGAEAEVRFDGIGAQLAEFGFFAAALRDVEGFVI